MINPWNWVIMKASVQGTPVSSASPAAQAGPFRFELEQNYPNPFNPSTVLRYQLPEAGDVRLTVFNTLGQKVTTLVQETQDSGPHEVKFDGSSLASGVYFYRLQEGTYVKTKRLLLIR